MICLHFLIIEIILLERSCLADLSGQQLQVALELFRNFLLTLNNFIFLLTNLLLARQIKIALLQIQHRGPLLLKQRPDLALKRYAYSPPYLAAAPQTVCLTALSLTTGARFPCAAGSPRPPGAPSRSAGRRPAAAAELARSGALAPRRVTSECS